MTVLGVEWVVNVYIIEGRTGVVSGTVHEPKNSRITVHGRKNSFSRITKIRKQDTLFNDPCLH